MLERWCDRVDVEVEDTFWPGLRLRHPPLDRMLSGSDLPVPQDIQMSDPSDCLSPALTSRESFERLLRATGMRQMYQARDAAPSDRLTLSRGGNPEP